MVSSWWERYFQLRTRLMYSIEKFGNRESCFCRSAVVLTFAAIWKLLNSKLYPELNSRRHLPFRHPRRHKGGLVRPPPSRFQSTCVVELSGKDQWIALDEYSRMMARFFDPGLKFDPVMRGQRSSFPKSENFPIYESISPKLFSISKWNFYHRLPRSILSRMAYWFRIFIK